MDHISRVFVCLFIVHYIQMVSPNSESEPIKNELNCFNVAEINILIRILNPILNDEMLTSSKVMRIC